MPRTSRNALDPEIEQRIEGPVSPRPSARRASRPPRRSRACGSGCRSAATASSGACSSARTTTRSSRRWWHVSNVNAVVADGDQRPLLGAHPDRREHRAEAPAPADEARRRAVAWCATTGWTNEDAEVVVVLSALTHCVGMSVHRTGHEDFSLFLCRAEAARAARRDLRRARPHGDRLRGAAGDHEPPRRRRAALARGRASCGSPTRSTWRRAARGSRSSAARCRCTRSPPPRSRRS